MAEPFVASVQYGDLKGTVAFDGHNGPPLHELAKFTNMPAGYFPVGFSLWRLHPDEDGLVPFRIVAVDMRDTGNSMDDIINFARTKDEVPVYPFDGKVSPAEFAALFKRFDLKAINKNLAKSNVVEYNAP